MIDGLIDTHVTKCPSACSPYARKVKHSVTKPVHTHSQARSSVVMLPTLRARVAQPINESINPSINQQQINQSINQSINH